MEVGDVIVVSGKSWVSKVIQKISGSKWTHTALYIGGHYIIETDWNTKTAIVRNTYPIDEYEYVVLKHRTPLTKKQKDNLIEISGKYHNTGSRYDWLMILSLLMQHAFPSFKTVQSENRFICTELVDEILLEAGINLFPDKKGDLFPHEFLKCTELYLEKAYLRKKE